MTLPLPHRPGRLAVAALSLGAIALFVLADLRTSPPIDPFDTPAPIALGSGAVPTGAHCATARVLD